MHLPILCNMHVKHQCYMHLRFTWRIDGLKDALIEHKRCFCLNFTVRLELRYPSWPKNQVFASNTCISVMLGSSSLSEIISSWICMHGHVFSQWIYVVEKLKCAMKELAPRMTPGYLMAPTPYIPWSYFLNPWRCIQPANSVWTVADQQLRPDITQSKISHSKQIVWVKLDMSQMHWQSRLIRLHDAFGRQYPVKDTDINSNWSTG